MTVVEGSVGDIGMQPMSGTLFARPVTMRRQDNMVITTERTPFEIVGGDLIDVDLVPGPAMLTIEVGSHVRRDFRVTVPAEGPVQLADLLEDAYEYTPEVVSVVAGYRNEALAARTGAVAARDAAEGSAGSASGAAGAATASATAAGDRATEADAARRLAEDAQSGAAAARSGAEAARDGAVTARGGAEQARDDAVSALSGLTGRVTTVEDSLPTKADLIGGRVDPAQLIGSGVTGSGIRVDKTVGTRVFVGETMIYGDTGWRRLVDSDFLNGWTSGTVRPMIRRLNDVVHLDLPSLGLTNTAATSNRFYMVPDGFKPPYTYGLAGVVTVGDSSTGVVRFETSARMFMLGTSNTGLVSGQLIWRTAHPWPVTLPGTAT